MNQPQGGPASDRSFGDYAVGSRIEGRWEVLGVCGGAGKSGMGVEYIVRDLPPTCPNPNRNSASAKGLITIGPEFDEPLGNFKPYME
jgi:hypothetical protein